MTKVSIIVPVYNAAERLERCIQSVLGQEYQDLELIAVDDGSTDDSAELLDEYATKDPRLKVIHKTNSGVSDTRNKGIEAAEGEFIQFIDADDWLPVDSTKLLVRAAEEYNADLVVGDFYRVVGQNVARKGSITINKVLNQKEYAAWMMETPADYYYGVLWNKFYRRNIIERYHLRMDTELSFCEDFVFNLEYVLRCQRIYPLQVPIYYYVRTEGSLVSQNMTPGHIIRSKTAVYEYYDQFFKELFDERLYEQERMHIARYLISAGTDGAVIPLMPGTKKLGEENVPVLYDAADSHNRISSSYYLRKLFDRYLNTVALKYGLSLKDVQIFHALQQTNAFRHHRDLSDYTGLSHRQVVSSLRKLGMEGFLHVHFNPDGTQVEDLDRAEPLIADIETAERDLVSACTKDFTEEEKKTASDLHERIYHNLRSALEGYEI